MLLTLASLCWWNGITTGWREVRWRSSIEPLKFSLYSLGQIKREGEVNIFIGCATGQPAPNEGRGCIDKKKWSLWYWFQLAKFLYERRSVSKSKDCFNCLESTIYFDWFSPISLRSWIWFRKDRDKDKCLASALAGSKLAQLTNFGTWTYFIVRHVSSKVLSTHLIAFEAWTLASKVSSCKQQTLFMVQK